MVANLSVAALAVCFASEVFAQTVPALVNYQGRLANPDGTALATGDYQLTFRVYDSATNSSGLVWGPQIFDGANAQGHGGKIPVLQGYFNVMLGPDDINTNSLANAFNATNRYVEIRVGTNNPILPRQQILSAPFALNSAKLAGADWSAVFGTNDPVNGKIPTTKLATNGAISATSFIGSGVGLTGLGILNMANMPTGTNFVGAGGLVMSLSTGITNITSLSEITLSNLSVTIVTTGRPVMLLFVSDSGDSRSYISQSSVSGVNEFTVSLFRGATRVTSQQGGIQSTAASHVTFPPTVFTFLDFAAPAGTNNYSIRCNVNASGDTVQFAGVRLCAFEL